MKFDARYKFLLIIALTIFLIFTYSQIDRRTELHFIPQKISDLFSYINVKNVYTSVNRTEESDNQANITLDSSSIINSSLQSNSSSISSALVISFQRFDQRKRFLKEQCKLFNLHESSDYFKYFLNVRMFYEQNHDFFVCLVAKSAASTWRTHLKNIERSHKKINGQKELTIEEKDNLAFSNTTTKVFTVRNPIERLISAYRDKFGDGHEFPTTNTITYWYDKAENILKKSLGERTNRSLSFENFIEFILKNPIKMDRHFRSVYSNCVPCKVDYDYIVHQETYSEDLMYLFHVLNITESRVEVRENWKGGKGKDGQLSDHYLKQLNSDQLVAIYDYLWTDFYLFDYPVPDFIFKALKEKDRKPKN